MAHDGSTLIGESITVTGNVSGDEDLTVRGRLEGSVSLAKTLIVESGGVVKAEVQVRSCVISGVVVGNIVASDSVEITKEARMVGDIAAPRVVIADGAGFRGRIDMGDVDVEAAGGERGSRTAAPRPALRPPARAAERPSFPARAAAGADEGEGERALPPSKPPAPPVPVAIGAVKRKVVVRRK